MYRSDASFIFIIGHIIIRKILSFRSCGEKTGGTPKTKVYIYFKIEQLKGIKTFSSYANSDNFHMKKIYFLNYICKMIILLFFVFNTNYSAIIHWKSSNHLFI